MNLAYPVLDLALFVVVVGLLMVLEWQAPPAVWALAAGIAGIAVSTASSCTRRRPAPSAPEHRCRRPPSPPWPWSRSAGWVRGRARQPRRDPLPNVVFPALFALVCLALLIFGTREDVPGLGIALAGAGVSWRSHGPA